MIGRAALLVLPMAACAQHSYAPGPGMAAANMGPDMARCRLFARGNAPGVGGFEASGSPRFVAAATATVLIAQVIGGAVHQSMDFDDCMQANGWRVADARPPAAAQGAAPTAAGPVAFAPPAPIVAVALPPLPTGPGAAVAPRRNLGLNLLPVDGPLASASALPAPEGLFVVDVLDGGAAARAGLLRNDVVLAFGPQPVHSVGALQTALSGVAHGSTVPVTVWRGGRAWQASLLF
jgi:hypothetical protein